MIHILLDCTRMSLLKNSISSSWVQVRAFTKQKRFMYCFHYLSSYPRIYEENDNVMCSRNVETYTKHCHFLHM